MAYSYDTRKWWQKLFSTSIPNSLDYVFSAKDSKDALTRALLPSWAYNLAYPEASQSDLNSDIVSALESEGIDFSNLSQSQLKGILDKYWEEDEKLLKTEHTFNYDSFLSDYNAMNEALAESPEAPDYDQLWANAQARADADIQGALKDLEDLRQMQVGNFNDELQSLASSYNTARSGILSQQYQQNAQLMDTLSSRLDRQNRNALEAGASAGIRLAGNINTLLSTQNKQSQTSLDTANQLAQMMVNQRNAEASVRSRYGDYMNQHFANKQSIQDSANYRAKDYYDTERDVAEAAYSQNVQNWDNAQWDNPLWEVRGTLGKSKYNKTGG